MENLVTYSFVLPNVVDTIKGEPVYFHGKQIGNVVRKEIKDNKRSVLTIECRPLFVPGTVGLEVTDDYVKLKLIR